MGTSDPTNTILVAGAVFLLAVVVLTLADAADVAALLIAGVTAVCFLAVLVTHPLATAVLIVFLLAAVAASRSLPYSE